MLNRRTLFGRLTHSLDTTLPRISTKVSTSNVAIIVALLRATGSASRCYKINRVIGNKRARTIPKRHGKYMHPLLSPSRLRALFRASIYNIPHQPDDRTREEEKKKKKKTKRKEESAASSASQRRKDRSQDDRCQRFFSAARCTPSARGLLFRSWDHRARSRGCRRLCSRLFEADAHFCPERAARVLSLPFLHSGRG